MILRAILIPVIGAVTIFITGLFVQAATHQSGPLYWVVMLPIGLAEMWLFVRWWCKD